MIDLWQLDPVWLVMVALTIAFSALVHGALGLGFPLLATPIIAVMLDVKLAILLTLLPTASVNIATIGAHSNYGKVVRRYAWLIIFSLLGAVLGAQLLAVSDPAPFRLLLAASIVLFLWANQRGQLPRAWLVVKPVLAMVFFGFLAGFFAGTTNVMVAVLIIYFLSLAVPRATMVAAMNSCFLVGKLSQIVVFWISGLVDLRLLAQSIPFAVIAVAFLLLGKKAGASIEAQSYRRLLQGLLAIMAVVLLLQYFYVV